MHTMATIVQLPSGKWRAQVRKSGIYRNATFPSKAAAKDWAGKIETQATHIATAGYAPIPKDATLADLIDKYLETYKREPGRTKAATLAMFRRKLGTVKVATLNAGTLSGFVDDRVADGAGGVTIAADLSFLSTVLKWARHARKLDVNERLALDARESLKHRGLETRSTERSREPTDDELKRLYELWDGNARQRIDMSTICRFALATGMRLGEICRIQVEDVDADAKTVLIRDRKDPNRKAGNDQLVPLLAAAWPIVAKQIEGRTAGKVFDVADSSVSTAFTRACQALEIVDLHFHDLRHRATAEFFRMGLTIPQVALLTGHKTWAMLRRYTDIKPADVHAALAPKKGRKKK